MKILMMLLSLYSAHASANEPKVIWVVIDGIRQLEFQGKAKDDFGKAVSANELFPTLMRFKKQSAFFPDMRISNPVGISLPAYSDMFQGRRVEKVLSNTPDPADFRAHYPTIFEAVKSGLKLGEDGVALHASWNKLCPIAAKDDQGFYRSCGWKEGPYHKPEYWGDSRSDMDTFIEFAREVPKRHPRFAFVHLSDADEEAHMQEKVTNTEKLSYGIFNYHKALHESDYYVARIWALLQADPFYKDSTYLIVNTDHGRDNWPNKDNWADHGRCVRRHGAKQTCSGCSHVFTIVMGPGIKPRVVKTNYTHTDLAPTIAKILGVEFPTATGKPMTEALPVTRLAKKN